MEKVGSLSADDLVQIAKLIFAEYGLPKTVSEPGKNFTSEIFKEFCRKMNIQRSITSSYHHQSTGQVEACLQSIKCIIKKSLDTDQDISLALLQIKSVPVGTGIPSPITSPFNKEIRGMLPQMSKENLQV